MSHIFISYSRKDLAIAERIIDALAIDDLEPWIDWKSIPKGETFEREIQQGIEATEIFLFLVSPDSAQSDWCNKEIDHAVRNGKRILPIVIRDTDPKTIHPEISKRNWIFCRDRQDDFNKAIEETRKAIHTDYEWLKFHTELQVKALKWEQKKDASRLLRGKELREAEQQLTEISSQEDPQPTKLQREYILVSQRNEVRTRRQITIGLVVGLGIMVVLSFVAWEQRNNAVNAQNTAVAEANAKATSLVNEKNARATAQAEKIRAEDQANIAFARQLAAQAQPLFANGNSKQLMAVLLAIQSMRTFPTGDAAQILQNNTLAHSIAHMTLDGSVDSIAFSPDSKYVVSGSSDGIARVWEVATSKEIARMTYDSDVTSIAFSSDGKYVVSGGCDQQDANDQFCIQGSARVWEATTGKEIARMTHGSYVNYVAFSPDGKYVVSGGCDQERNILYRCQGQGTARVWESATGKEITHVTYDGSVGSIALSPNGKYVVSGRCDQVDGDTCWQEGSTHVWEATTGKEVSYMPHNLSADTVITNFTVAFSPDSKVVASVEEDSIRVWDITTGKEIASTTYESEVECIAFSPDGNYIVSSGGNAIHSWNIATGKEVARMTHDSTVYSVAFSPDGKSVGSESADGTVRVWNAATGKEIAHITLAGHFAFSPDSKYVASDGCDHRHLDATCTYAIRVWEAATEKEIAVMHHDGNEFGLGSDVYSVAFSPNSKFVVSGSADGTARVWDATTGKEVARMTHDASTLDAVHSVAFSPDGKYVVSGSDDKTVRVWDAATGKEIARMTHDTGGLLGSSVYSVTFSPDGKYVVSGSVDGTARVWEATTGKEIARMTHMTTRDSQVLCVAFSPDGKYVVSGSADGTARMWEATTGKEIARMTHEIWVTSVAFSPDGRYVVSGSGDGTARVWYATTGKEIARMTTPDDHVSSVAFSPDGRFVVSGSWDRTVRVWETATGKEIARMTHEDTVVSVAFSSDGNYVVSGSSNNFGQVWDTRVWEVATGKEMARMTYDTGVNSIAFSPDNKYIVSGIRDGTVHVWKWRPEDLIDEACSRVTRNLTRAEWTQYIGNALPYQAICPNLPIEPEITITPTP